MNVGQRCLLHQKFFIDKLEAKFDSLMLGSVCVSLVLSAQISSHGQPSHEILRAVQAMLGSAVLLRDLDCG